MPIVMASSSFNLSGGDAGFSSRSNSIFDNLNSISNNLSMNKTDIIPVKRKRTTSKEGGEDGDSPTKVPRSNTDKDFKKPEEKTASCKAKKPGSWTKYDLSDVNVSDDRGNSNTALSFLHSLSKREDASKDCSVDSAMDTTSKVVFEKPTGCVKMPEYVVGGPKQPRKPKPASKRDPSASAEELELDHLTEPTEASDYQAEIEAKWLAQNKPLVPPVSENQPSMDVDQKPAFKSVNKKKRRQNVRSRTNVDDDE